MKEKRKSNQGITLIALVITIIVLLILAAVSIATLTGENGILTKATKAKSDTQIAEEDEKVKLAIASAFDDQGKFDQDLFLNELKKQGLSGEKNGDGNVVVTASHTIYTINGKGKIINQTSTTPKPEEEWKTLASQIDANNYGDFVDYEMDLDGNGDTKDDWKIFYRENGRVFLIAADFLDYIKNNDKLDFENTKLQRPYLEKGGKYPLNWNKDNLPTVQSNGIEANLFKATKYDITNSSYSSNINAKCVYALLNTSYWKNFINPSYADQAIGAPTLEMWVASWNAKGNLKGKEKYTELTASATEGSYGYKINDNDTIDLSKLGSSEEQTGYYDMLYFPASDRIDIIKDMISSEEEVNDVWSYWLASPSASDSDSLLYVSYDGFVYCHRDDWSNAVRPLVSLKSSIKGNRENGVWKLTN